MNNEQARPRRGGVKRLLKRIALGVLAVVAIVALSAGIWAYTKIAAYDASIDKVYDIAPIPVALSTDPAVIARGEHLSKSLAPCALSDCHGANLAGGKVLDSGPIGTVQAPNITALMATYSDAELARLIRHGVKKDGRTVLFMPADEWNWLPKSDVDALVSYLRTIKPIENPSGRPVIGAFGKVMDRLGYVPIDIAHGFEHENIETGPAPSATPEYGKWISHQCNGCHGDKHMAGGPIKGTPPDFPVPRNITPHETGLKGWTYDDFEHLAATGLRKNGDKLASFMPVEALDNMDATEKHALWSYLESLPPVPFGER